MAKNPLPSDPKSETTAEQPPTTAEAPPTPPNLGTHPLVDKLHTDPDDTRNLVSLVGYIGPSKKPDSIRLYLDLGFKSYYEIPKSGVVSTSAAGDDPNSPTTVFVDATTPVEVVTVQSQSVAAGYLQGAIASGYLGGASGHPCINTLVTSMGPVHTCINTIATSTGPQAQGGGQPCVNTLVNSMGPVHTCINTLATSMGPNHTVCCTTSVADALRWTARRACRRTMTHAGRIAP